ncbi:MAG TPA: hypothetical protein VHQ47_10695 [Phycisphaerae bacterium]|nr:hypothetical protein [Phycisphaerae bacterium]HVV73806.1 hypothetical protein [Verrucomicrobiae bacterium]
MGLTDRDVLASRVCREVLRNPSYAPSRTRELIEWLKSDLRPTADIAGRALAALGPQAFDDLLNDVLSRPDLPKPSLVWALELFPERHERLLPLLRDWLGRSAGDLRLQVAVSIAHIITERLEKRLPVDQADVSLFKSVLVPAMNRGAIRVHLRDFELAAAEAG